MKRFELFSVLICGSMVSAGGVDAANAATISRVGITHDVTDFSAAGLNIGTAGYWFANFDSDTPTTDAPVAENAADALPSWLAVNFDPTSGAYSFPADNLDGKPYAVSYGGQTGFNNLTLPDGSTRLSGQVVDVRMSPGGTDTLVKDLTFGPGFPQSVLFHVIVDNAPLADGTAVSRVRATYRLPEDGNTIVRALWEGAEIENNGNADVYTFRLDGIEATGYLAIQLRAADQNLAAGLAGFAFDAVPEPASATLIALGIAVVSTFAFRRPC
jgi:PEP-CTERM motif